MKVISSRLHYIHDRARGTATATTSRTSSEMNEALATGVESRQRGHHAETGQGRNGAEHIAVTPCIIIRITSISGSRTMPSAALHMRMMQDLLPQ